MRRPRINPRRAAILFTPLRRQIGDLHLDIALSVAIVSEGPPSAYALVWEYGNIRQTKKGPKTTLGFDPETGKRVWLTIQAPTGYVRMLTPIFRGILHQEIETVKWGRKDTKQQLVRALNRAAQHMVMKIKEYVPVDTGALKDSITFIPPMEISKLKKQYGGTKGFK